MLPKLMVALACVVLVLVLAASGVFNTGTQQTDKVRWEDKNSLKEIARRSKEAGLGKISIPGPIIEYPGMNMQLDDALRDYSVVVAEVVASKSYSFNSDAVRSWYKFRIVDALSEKNANYCPTCPTVPDPPQDLLPLAYHEFLLATAGGTVNVDGVDITVTNQTLPEFESGELYLLVISLTPSKVALLSAGPSGVFRIDESDKLKAVNKTNRPIQVEINRRFAGKLSQLKSHVKTIVQSHSKHRYVSPTHFTHLA